MKSILSVAVVLLFTSSAFAHHKGFHLQCFLDPKLDGALKKYHAFLHAASSSLIKLPGHGPVDVDAVSMTIAQHGGQTAVCATISWLSR